MDLPTPAELRERRTATGLTQSALAEAAEVSQPLIARIEGGDVDPRLSTLRRIVAALDAAEGEIVRAADVMTTEVVAVAPDDAVRTARDRMIAAGFSQVPVVDGGRAVGIVANSDIRQVAEPERLEGLDVAAIMQEAISTTEPETPLVELEASLDHHAAVLVVSAGRLVGIITDADLAARL
ncbi:MAG: CBS domain-containing protein [Haloquadratum sp.]|jgi:predicted transcriptional regulator|nr:CBS domain-containing protein [Haloferacaceae archaeon]MDR9445109.1 CBS domain-containing protein [Haloquadratum sp.]